ncbi:uncharacterized protein PAN0_011d4381 [Moesziomyces antarcticus]|uniref:Uncharacterized protein n=2 Tax=Pseudozyma antarctica TaxID=84753 RepID=A0A5C3FTR4_PSEA2|nr:uncharacterized protein PAN0_011d4381 [Moesziomyces antarcticus]GAK66159.1 hypothetical protein PAN0_011d4381 [Moesziomyces antarcticus]SPO46937.1 uncharacterized protein PSANT_04623 [Moesziomyces antarcticus]
MAAAPTRIDWHRSLAASQPRSLAAPQPRSPAAARPAVHAPSPRKHSSASFEPCTAKSSHTPIRLLSMIIAILTGAGQGNATLRRGCGWGGARLRIAPHCLRLRRL